MLCATASYFQQHGQPEQLSDLQNHHYIHHSSRSLANLIRLKPSYQVTLQPFLTVNSVTAMLDCAEQDIGLIQLPFYMLEPYLEKKVFIEVLSEYQAVNASVYYHYPKFRYRQPKVRAFIDYFLENKKSNECAVT